jgi:GntR family transcriptional regulator, transcriptional repressor for pyruvate dehydrogenase complex
MTKSAAALPAQVAQSLLQRIINQEIQPGAVIPTERELQEQYSVSRTVVREAVKSLEARGLIVNNGGQGATVNANLTDSSTQALLLAFHRAHVTTGDLLKTRLLLEPQIAADAAAHATEVQIRRLHALERAMEALLDSPGTSDGFKVRDAWASADSRFHIALAEASQNPLLAILIEILVGIAWQQRSATEDPINEEQIRTATAQHKAITQTIAARSPEQAHRLMLEHLESTRSHVQTQPEGLQRLIQLQLL